MPLPMFQEKKKSHPLDGIKKIIAVAAGKGGVGKSTVSVNLGLALKFLGYKVGIFDADVYGPSIRKMLPEDKLPTRQGEDIIPATSHGIKLVSMAYFRPEDESASVRAPIANGIITQFIEKVIWGDLDFLLIDFPPGTGDIQLTLGQKANLSAAVMVTTPQEVAMMDVKKAMHLFDQIHVPIAGVIENMSYYYHKGTKEVLHLFGKEGGERLAKEREVPFLGGIPIDPVLSKYSDEGRSIFTLDTEETHHVRQSFLQLSKNLIHYLKTLEQALEIRDLKIRDHTFSVEWSDGLIQDISFSEVQKHCPCAACANLSQQPVIGENLTANTITNVGKYAIRIHFVSGCNHGIYEYDLLRKLGKRKVTL